MTRRGARWPALVGAVAFGVVLALAAVAGSVEALAAVLFLMGLSAGTLDVTINVMGVAVEREQGRRILSSMHAAYSLGGMAGAAVGALAAAAAISPRTHLPIVAVVVVAVAVLAFGRLPADAVGERGPAFARPTRALARSAWPRSACWWPRARSRTGARSTSRRRGRRRPSTVSVRARRPA